MVRGKPIDRTLVQAFMKPFCPRCKDYHLPEDCPKHVPRFKPRRPLIPPSPLNPSAALAPAAACAPDGALASAHPSAAPPRAAATPPDQSTDQPPKPQPQPSMSGDTTDTGKPTQPSKPPPPATKNTATKNATINHATENQPPQRKIISVAGGATKKGRGRPPTGKALSATERSRLHRARKKAAPPKGRDPVAT